MNTQDTKVHIKLWHRDFWFMALANLLLSMSAYSLLPIIPSWLKDTQRLFSVEQTGMVMGVFGVGMFALGGFCSYLVQHFRRNIVCLIAIASVAACSGVLFYTERYGVGISFAMFILLRFVHGACYGLAKMVLASTLIIDTCESSQRTEANYSAAWFARFALSLGPIMGLLCSMVLSTEMAFLSSILCALLALALVKLVSFPFRAPEENVRLVCLDRFLLPQGLVLFINLMLTSSVAGLLFSTNRLTLDFYGFMICGFLLALLAKRFVFANADLKSEAVCGLLIIIASILTMLVHTDTATQRLAPVLFGLGIGITSSRFLLFFIKLSRHCQRGTSQSTYLLGWELGISAGLFVGFTLLKSDWAATATTAICVAAIALAMYVWYTHTWFLNNKNR